MKTLTGKVCTKKDCTSGGTPQPLSEFQRNAQNSDGLRSWCNDCYRAYQREYHRGRKYQPKADEMMKAIDREPRSDWRVAQRNRSLHERRRSQGQKIQCAYPGCVTNIGYLQERLCRMHEREMAEEKMARKLRLGK